MKIVDTHTAVPVQSTTTAATQASPAHQKEEQERVSLERTRSLRADLEQAKIAAGTARAAQLQALEAAIRNGNYRPSAQQLAEKLLQSAELEARLRVLLDK